jgi:radical SAM protein with 4Fe4S-binding SPASM domain
MVRKGGLDCAFCGILGIIGVLPDGAWALCGLPENLPELTFGHASRDRLDEIWNDTPILRELRQGLPHRLEGVCRDCLHQAACQGSCIIQNYSLTRSLWAPFWYCRQAEELGLFPASRKRQAAAVSTGTGR